MSNLFLTLIIAFVVIVLAIACLAIGWLIKGRTKVEATPPNSELNHFSSTDKNSSPPIS